MLPAGSKGDYPQFLWKQGCASGVQPNAICFPQVSSPPFGYPFNLDDDTLPAAKRALQNLGSCYTPYDGQFESPRSGVEELQQAGFSIYPNPSQGELNIYAESGGQFSLFDLHGRVIMQLNVRQGASAFSLQDIGPGLYVFEFMDEAGTKSVGRLILL